jgi:predicted DCC family thiol-disulfide oxidoreductase YuxK
VVEPFVQPATDRTVVLFDGVCNLCHAWVRFVIARDPDAHVVFAPLQSDTGRRLLAAHGSPHAGADSVVVIADDVALVRSAAALAVADRLRAPWPLLARLARLVPRGLRDSVYDLVAQGRYRWFGRRDACALPDATPRDRFLDDPPSTP